MHVFLPFTVCLQVMSSKVTEYIAEVQVNPACGLDIWSDVPQGATYKQLELVFISRCSDDYSAALCAELARELFEAHVKQMEQEFTEISSSSFCKAASEMVRSSDYHLMDKPNIVASLVQKVQSSDIASLRDLDRSIVGKSSAPPPPPPPPPVPAPQLGATSILCLSTRSSVSVDCP
eukprot:TRINITY_DN15308_c0_g1_i1.p2 TRINITY_DN15308_c0_g1~~TRINITY_DN15308_c0_g1_i1.p2  ORF type:complete len:177 (+),score=38.67 TRINITY_DN15308_c0_g1_i1:76-606(+)